ncbi:MAG TPA: hypothetical protein VMG08_02395 [Allosphingosinicella sp.]|nr:hypothetical protein [Allosphingosinicella sp.]
MLIAAILAALLQPTVPAGPPDPISRALDGLVAVVEEDGNPDARLEGMATRDCETHVTATGRRWTIDWRQETSVALADTFVFITAPAFRIAIVADTSRPDQASRLGALNEALRGLAERCAAGAR